MTNAEKTLYHQIHPAKLATDWGTGIIALFLLWQHQWIGAAIMALIPPVVATLLIMRYANLEKQKNSAFGHYILNSMPRWAETLRLLGYAFMGTGAWVHLPWMIAVGMLVIVFAWTNGLILRRTA